MGKDDRCVMGSCNNDKRYPERFIKHSNVSGALIMQKLPVDNDLRSVWIHNIRKGRMEFTVPKNCFVCSNHFVDGKPTKENPSPTLFLTASMNVKGTPDKKDGLCMM